MGNRSSRSRHRHASYTQGSQSRPDVRYRSPVVQKLHSQKYSRIMDQYKTVDQVTTALRESGLESSNMIVGIDFTKSNEWTGRHSFNGRSLHEIGGIPNPYEQAISIIGRTLSPFDEDNLIPCFGFGDASTHDYNVFSFNENHRPCHGFEEALARYKEIVPHLLLAGPTSFAPIIEVAMDIVEKSGGQYHVLVIVADGQVTRSSDTKIGFSSSQEQKTIEAIVAASHYALSIVLVGVGDGPWETMEQFDDNIPTRAFDNFQFVNFTKIMSKNMVASEKEAAFALAALMEIPIQYKATVELDMLGRRVGKVPGIVPRLPPFSVMEHDAAGPNVLHSTALTSIVSQSSHGVNSHVEVSLDGQNQVCPICLTSPRDLAFGCGHMTCRVCGQSLSNCPLCRAPITTRVKLYAT
eukprot:Gb_21536 [translate_table: standard]